MQNQIHLTFSRHRNTLLPQSAILHKSVPAPQRAPVAPLLYGLVEEADLLKLGP